MVTPWNPLNHCLSYFQRPDKTGIGLISDQLGTLHQSQQFFVPSRFWLSNRLLLQVKLHSLRTNTMTADGVFLTSPRHLTALTTVSFVMRCLPMTSATTSFSSDWTKWFISNRLIRVNVQVLLNSAITACNCIHQRICRTAPSFLHLCERSSTNKHVLNPSSWRRRQTPNELGINGLFNLSLRRLRIFPKNCSHRASGPQPKLLDAGDVPMTFTVRTLGVIFSSSFTPCIAMLRTTPTHGSSRPSLLISRLQCISAVGHPYFVVTSASC